MPTTIDHSQHSSNHRCRPYRLATTLAASLAPLLIASLILAAAPQSPDADQIQQANQSGQVEPTPGTTNPAQTPATSQPVGGDSPSNDAPPATEDTPTDPEARNNTVDDSDTADFPVSETAPPTEPGSARTNEAPTAPEAVEAPKEPAPTRIIALEIVDLSVAWHTPRPTVQVFLPRGYDPDKQYPLLVWLGRGWGSHEVDLPARIAGDSGFICAALPYQALAKIDGSYQGGWMTPWPFYRGILDQLEKQVPNIDPDRRICAGHGTGGMAILWLISNSDGQFLDYFSASMPGGSGWMMSGLALLKDHHLLLHVASRSPGYTEYHRLARLARAARIDCQIVVHEDASHAVPPSLYPTMRAWLADRVAVRPPPPATTPHAPPSAEAAAPTPDAPDDPADPERPTFPWETFAEDGEWSRALPLIRQALENAPPSSPTFSAALQAVEQADHEAGVQLDWILAKSPTPRRLKTFIRQWTPCPTIERAARACNRVGQRQIDEILAVKDRQIIEDLRAFLRDWEGFDAYHSALAAYENEAQWAFSEAASDDDPARRGAQLLEFAAQWSPAPSAEQAMKQRDELAATALAEVLAEARASTKARGLKSFISQWANTPAVSDAAVARRQIAEQILAEILAIPNEKSRTMRLKGFARSFEDTQAGGEASRVLLNQRSDPRRENVQ